MNTIWITIPRPVVSIIESLMRVMIRKSEPAHFREDPDTLLCNTLWNLDQARALLAQVSLTGMDEFSLIPLEVLEREFRSLRNRLGAYEIPGVLIDACCENDTQNPQILFERSRQLFKEVKKFMNRKTEKDHEKKIFQSPLFPLCGNGYCNAVQLENEPGKNG
jgi:hypothetical protein